MDEYDIWNNLTYLEPVGFLLGVLVILLIGSWFRK